MGKTSHDAISSCRRFIAVTSHKQLGGCQNYGPLLGTLNIRCRIIAGIQKGTIILSTTRLTLLDSVAADSCELAVKARQRRILSMDGC